MGRMDGDDREPPVTSQGGEAGGTRGRGRWGRRGLTGLIAFAAVGGFAMIVVYSYDKGREAGTSAVAPVIQAQEGPTRIRPDAPGGMAVPNQDKQVFSRIDPGQPPPKVERLLPPAESPVSRPPAPAEPPPAEPAAGRDAQTASAPPAAPPEAPAAGEAAPAPPPTGAESKGPPPTRPAPAAPAPSAVPPPPGIKDYKVQLASLRSEDAAKRAWTRLRSQHKDLFDGLSPAYVRADVPGKGTFYRVQAGPLADAEAARTLCDRIKSRKLGCLVVRP
ncbi:MAG: hypothetical protein GEU92_08995 [Alphaproteobacteria bacterium]|nr:hypothetical protein [Alphaproteobacteria bacterium]